MLYLDCMNKKHFFELVPGKNGMHVLTDFGRPILETRDKRHAELMLEDYQCGYSQSLERQMQSWEDAGE